MSKFRALSFTIIVACLFIFVQATVANAAPAAPSSLKATVTGSSTISLTWKAVSGASKYQVYRGTSTSSMTRIATVTKPIYTASALTSSKTYYFKVKALTSSGTAGKFSSTVEARTKTGIASPTGLKAVSATSTQINLSWGAVSGASKYTVYRTTSSTGTYAKIATVTGRSYSNKDLKPSKRYYYKVRAVNSKGEGKYSSAATAVTRPSIPKDLKAAATSATSIKLTWSAGSTASKYIIYRTTTKLGTYTKIGESTVTSYTNTGLSANKLYYYKVSAVNSAGAGSKSPAAVARTRPVAPTGLIAASRSATSIGLTWNTVTGASKYIVYRSTSSAGTYAKVGEATGTSYTNTGLTANKVYYYKVSAVNSGGEGVASAVVSVTTLPNSSLPAPGNFSAATYNYQSVQLYYDTVQNAVTYRIYYQKTTTPSNNIDDYLYFDWPNKDCRVIGLEANSQYYFRVAAVAVGNVVGTPTGFVGAKTSTAVSPAMPRFTLTGINVVGSSYRMIFDHAISVNYPAAMDGTFEFYYATTEAGLAYDEPDVVSTQEIINGSMFFYEDVAPGSAGWYGFRACFGTYKSPMQKLNLAALLKPTNVNTQSFGTQIGISWNSVQQASRYHIYWCTSTPDTTQTWAEFKASTSSEHLKFLGYTASTSASVLPPRAGTHCYIVVPATSSGVEGADYGMAWGTIIYG